MARVGMQCGARSETVSTPLPWLTLQLLFSKGVLISPQELFLIFIEFLEPN